MPIKYAITIVKKSPNGFRAWAYVTNHPEQISEQEGLLSDDEVMFVNEIETNEHTPNKRRSVHGVH